MPSDKPVTTQAMNEVAKRCEIAAIERDLGDDNGQLRDLLEDAAKEIENLTVQLEAELKWRRDNDGD
jgi:hypothetical protein